LHDACDAYVISISFYDDGANDGEEGGDGATGEDGDAAAAIAGEDAITDSYVV
jgi:hypothetical protein